MALPEEKRADILLGIDKVHQDAGCLGGGRTPREFLLRKQL